MYWYYKVPLIVLALLLATGLSILSWRALTGSKKVSTPAPQQSQEEVPPALPPLETDTTASQQATISPTEPPAATTPQLTNAEKALAADEPQKARTLALALLSQFPAYSQEWKRCAEVINSANKIFMNSTAPCPEKKTHVVVRGDNLTRIAYRNNSTVSGLQRLNKLNPTNPIIHPGNALQYIQGTWSIKVSKQHFLLCLYLDNNLYRLYPISTGRQGRTPAGTFIINDKVRDPAWTPPGVNIPAGDPRNILGTRWMGITPTGQTNPTLRGFGIHGTTEPETIGTSASLGCVRMRNEDVEELYDFIPDSFAKQHIAVTIEE